MRTESNVGNNNIEVGAQSRTYTLSDKADARVRERAYCRRHRVEDEQESVPRVENRYAKTLLRYGIVIGPLPP